MYIKSMIDTKPSTDWQVHLRLVFVREGFGCYIFPCGSPFFAFSVIFLTAVARRLVRGAKNQQLTVAEWVRQALRKALWEQPIYATRKKIQVVREAVRHTYPIGDIEEMLGEIARGQQNGLDS